MIIIIINLRLRSAKLVSIEPLDSFYLNNSPIPCAKIRPHCNVFAYVALL
jgi:hypothetical protein